MNTLENIFQDDQSFDLLFPAHFQLISKKQWTPLAVAKQAATFLSWPGSKVLDIGCGIGKFCIIGAKCYPETLFFGVEQRQELIHVANDVSALLKLNNLEFIHANMIQLNFNDFDHFYFYNSFFENIDFANRIDDSVETSMALYAYYTMYLRANLDKMPTGTKAVVYQGSGNEVSENFVLVKSAVDDLLKMYIKIS